MSADPHAKASGCMDGVAKSIGYLVLGIIGLFVLVIFLRGLFLSLPAPVGQYLPASVTTAIAPAVPVAPALNPSSPPHRFFNDVLDRDCSPYDVTYHTCVLDYRGTPPLTATRPGMRFCSDPADGRWQRWDPQYQQWFSWNPATEERVVTWQRFIPDERVYAPLSVTYWLC